MADLADQIDEYICTFEGVGDLSKDTLAMLIFLLAVVAIFLLWLCKFLYNKYGKKSTNATVGGDVKPGDKLRKSEPKDSVLSKDVKGLDLASKPRRAGALGGGRPRTNSSGSESTARKRLARKSPGPELRQKRHVPPPSNVVGPETTSVNWTSQVFRWLYSDLVIVNELLQTWVQSINETSRKSTTATENSVAVDIVRVLPESPPPNLTNIFCNSTEQNPSEMTISCDCDCTPVLQIKAFKTRAGNVETLNYKATISRLKARLNAKMNYNTLNGHMQIEGFPDIRITLNSIGAIKSSESDEKKVQDTISEILIKSIRESVYPIDFSMYATCPRGMPFETKQETQGYSLYDQYDSFRSGADNFGNGIIAGKPSNRRLLVKLIKGEGLKNAQDPFCTIEMDEPPQKNQTGSRHGVNPYWDEHFLFDLSPTSAEILFEVYNRATNSNEEPKFIGLGLVGIDELAVGPASVQVLTLQPRPYENEQVFGAITAEFVFMDGAELPANGAKPYKLKEALKISTPIKDHGGNVADKALQALERGALGIDGQPSKSTLIIHSVQRHPQNQSGYSVEMNSNGQIEINETNDYTESTLPSDTTQNEDTANMDASDLSTANNDNANINNINNNSYEHNSNNINSANDANSKCEINDANNDLNNAEATDEVGTHTSLTYQRPTSANGHHSALTDHNGSSHMENGSSFDDQRGRSVRKKRDFFGTLKRRLGRSKTRTKSAERDMIPIDGDGRLEESIRSMSADRNNGINNGSHSNTSTGTRLMVPTLSQSRRSSMSESSSAISGFSSASTKTYLHEASTLVLETIENGVKKHFLVPLAVAQKPRWRRKGTKLHIYNDHTFVAKHLSGGLTCDICTRSIPRRPGKQGYECRDCSLKCHKQCHVRAPQPCTNPTALSMELSKLNSAAAERSIRK